MNKKVFRKKLLTLLMIISIVATDFFVLGSNLLTYSSDISDKTNNPNVEFVAYFKNDANERVDSIEKSIKDDNLKLYTEVIVKNEGYLNEGTAIEIEDSNFKLKNNILSPYIKEINGNKVFLKQITAGETIEIELDIEPIISETLEPDMLSKISIVKLNGSYTGSTDGGIQYGKPVCMNFKPDGTATAELETDIITNAILPVGTTNKRVVQLLIKSRLAENQYPVKQTKLNVSIPDLGTEVPEISVLEIGKLATNGETNISNVTTENGIVEIEINNNVDENNNINWIKNAYDEIIVTYLYPETVDVSDMELVTNSEIKVISSETPYTNTDTEKEEQELKNVVIARTEIIPKEMYKGQLYTSANEQYNTKTTLAVTKEGIVGKITINEGQDAFGTDENELEANTKYITTEINLEKILSIFGQDGNIEIRNGENVILINKETPVNQNGNVVITHGENSTSNLVITTSNPVNTGVLEIYHTKAITGSYTRTQLKDIKTLKAKGVIEGTITVEKEEQKIVENSTETINSNIELMETISKAELTIENNKNTLSTTEVNEMTLGITLITDGTQYDLYKNPKISIKFPTDVENVVLKSTPSKQNMDEFTTVHVGKFNQDKKTIQIEMQGEQTVYPESALTQSYLQLNLEVTLSQLATNKTDKIIMAFMNENASQYEGGTTDLGLVEKTVEISAQPGLLKMFNLSLNKDTSLTQPITQLITNENIGKEITLETILINNTNTDLNNIKILGKLPTTGNVVNEKENTLETTLTNINATGATIYYTENPDATIGMKEAWTQDLGTLTNAKLYLIEIENLPKSATYKITSTIEIPKTMPGNVVSYAQYSVTCDETTEVQTSREIGLMTSLIAELETSLIAQVGNDVLKNGDIVKEGEVIKYTAIVKNNGTKKLENIQIKAEVPTGTVVVEPAENYEYKNYYYEEKVDIKEIELTIHSLEGGEVYTTSYEVRVNTNNTTGTEISNKLTTSYDNSSVKSEEIKNIIEEASIRVTVSCLEPKFSGLPIDETMNNKFQTGEVTEYQVHIENISSSTINNLELQIISKGFDIKTIDGNTEIPEKILIKELISKEADDGKIETGYEGEICFTIYGQMQSNAENMDLYAIVTDSNGQKHRSNILTDTFDYLDATITLSSPQDGKTVKEGDKVEYCIIAKNIGEAQSKIQIKDVIPEFFKVQEVKVNNKITMQITDNTDEETYVKQISNYREHSIILKKNEQVQIDIISKVGYIPETYNGKNVTNNASVEINNILKDTSKIVTHVLQANLMQDETLENVISGFVWFDSNENGKKDGDEKFLSDIGVKIYDLSKKDYLANLQTKTDEKGKYSFTKIEDGSYLVVFEFDRTKYELTTPFAEGVETSINSKAVIIDKLAAIEINNLKENSFNMNVGLKEGSGNLIDPERPGAKNTISGLAWLDENRNGQKDKNEKTLEGIKARLYDISNKNIAEVTTDTNGKYIFKNIENGEYIILFEYDTEEYEPTIYLAEGVPTTQNSKVVLKKMSINGEEKTLAATDKINVQANVSNMNIGLKEKLIFDLELNKYISRIVVQTTKGTKAYDYENDTFEKVEIHRKQIQGALVVLEYTIKVKNNGEMPGYAKNIVDYLPNGLVFSSELNKDWYLSGNYLYTKSLENVELAPGKEKEIKLILTKTMTNENIGLINNRAEIYEDYNKYGDGDIDSTPNNQVPNEDDFGASDVIIQVATGGSITAYVILLIINMLLIGIAIKIMLKNNIIKKTIKEERR